MATEKFHELFASFIKLFKESGKGYDESYLNDDQAAVTRTYWSFCLKNEVKSVDELDGRESSP